MSKFDPTYFCVILRQLILSQLKRSPRMQKVVSIVALQQITDANNPDASSFGTNKFWSIYMNHFEFHDPYRNLFFQQTLR